MRSQQQRQQQQMSAVRNQTRSLNTLRNRNIQEEKRPISKTNTAARSYNHIRNPSSQLGNYTQLQSDSRVLQKPTQKNISAQIFSDKGPTRTNSNKFIQQQQQVYFKGTTQLNPYTRYQQNNQKVSISITRSQNQIQSESQMHQAIDLRTSPVLKTENPKIQLDIKLPKLGPVKANHDIDPPSIQQQIQQQQQMGENQSPPIIKKNVGDKRLTISNQALSQKYQFQQQQQNGPLTDQSTNNVTHQTRSRSTTPQQKQQQYHQKSQSVDQKQQSIEPNQTQIIKNRSPIDSISTKTQAGKNPDKSTKTNQDSYIQLEQFGDQKQFSLFSVCDGHGIEGHKASQFVRDVLPSSNFIKYIFLQDFSNKIFKIADVLTISFKKTNQSLHDEPSIDSTFSGTTVVLALLYGNTIYVANAGDSRVMVGRLNSSNQIQGIGLSNDHKPDLPQEQKRIEQSGGRVQAYLDFDGTPVGPARVWMKDADIPGLAMSRSLGDRVAQQCGVTAEPEVTLYEIKPEDKFLVLASDGVWEFLSNQQVAEMVNPFYQRNSSEQAAVKLIKESTQLWKENDEVIDDITCIVVFFQKSQ